MILVIGVGVRDIREKLGGKYMTPLEMVLEFHRKYAVHISTSTNIDNELVRFRFNLIDEEFWGLSEAFKNKNVIATADALGDLVYVTYGTAISLGINLDKVLEEIHRSNMTKYLPEDADPNVPHKIQKGSDYSPPNLEPILRRGLWN